MKIEVFTHCCNMSCSGVVKHTLFLNDGVFGSFHWGGSSCPKCELKTAQGSVHCSIEEG